MPNFAQEFPFLLFLPLVIFAAVAVTGGVVQLAVLIEARMSARLAAQRLATSRPIQAEKPALVVSIEQQRARQLKLPQTRLALEAEYRRVSAQVPLAERIEAIAREVAALSKAGGRDMTKAEPDQIWGAS
jgi:hypothetical protein